MSDTATEATDQWLARETAERDRMFSAAAMEAANREVLRAQLLEAYEALAAAGDDPDEVIQHAGSSTQS